MRQETDEVSAGEARHREQLTSLFKRYHGSFCRVARTVVRCPADAEDAVQSAYLRLLRADADPARLQVAYAGRAVVNAARDLLRRRAARHRALEGWHAQLLAELPPLSRPGPSDGRWTGTTDELWAALARLPPGQRRVLTRIHLDEASPAEVAREEGVCVPSVHQRVWRARRALRALLGAGEALGGGKA